MINILSYLQAKETELREELKQALQGLTKRDSKSRPINRISYIAGQLNSICKMIKIIERNERSK